MEYLLCARHISITKFNRRVLGFSDCPHPEDQIC